MHSVGAFEAKTHLSALLERVAAGEEIVITKHGKPVARLVPERAAALDKDELIRRIKETGKGLSFGGLNWKDLRDEGRR